MNNGMIECSVCHSKLVPSNSKAFSKAYDRHKSRLLSKQRALNVLLVVGDCMLVGLQVCYLIQELIFLSFASHSAFHIQVKKLTMYNY